MVAWLVEVSTHLLTFLLVKVAFAYEKMAVFLPLNQNCLKSKFYLQNCKSQTIRNLVRNFVLFQVLVHITVHRPGGILRGQGALTTGALKERSRDLVRSKTGTGFLN